MTIFTEHLSGWSRDGQFYLRSFGEAVCLRRFNCTWLVPGEDCLRNELLAGESRAVDVGRQVNPLMAFISGSEELWWSQGAMSGFRCRGKWRPTQLFTPFVRITSKADRAGR